MIPPKDTWIEYVDENGFICIGLLRGWRPRKSLDQHGMIETRPTAIISTLSREEVHVDVSRIKRSLEDYELKIHNKLLQTG